VARKSDQFTIMLNGVEVGRKGPGGALRPGALALNVAQGMACNVYKEPVRLTIVREPVLGPASVLYQVDRVASGSVFTTTISEED
jgi:hypothetical protein